MIEIRLDVGAAQRYLEGLSRRAVNMAPAMAAIATELLSQTEANFAAQGRPRWMGLQHPPERRRGGMILQDTGRLAASVTPFHGAAEAGVGSNLPYAAIHQLGGTTRAHRIVPKKGKALKFGGKYRRAVNHPGAKIPARPYLPVVGDRLQPEAERAVIGIVSHYLASLGG